MLQFKQVGLFRDRSFEQIPCYRNSFMYALLGSFGASLGHFMITSKLFDNGWNVHMTHNYFIYFQAARKIYLEPLSSAFPASYYHITLFVGIMMSNLDFAFV